MRNLVVLGLVTLLMACWSPQAWAKSATLTFSVTGTGPWTVSVNMNNDAAAAAVQLVIRYDSSKLSTTGSVSKTTRTTDMGIVDGNVPTAGELRIAIMDTDSPTPDVIAAGSGAIVSTTFSGTADVLYFTVDGVEKTAVFDDNGDAFNLVTYSYNLSTGSSEKRGESKDIASGTTGDVEFLDGSDTSGGVTIDLTTWPGGDVTVERKDDPVPGSYSGFTLLNLSWEIETTATGNFKMDITFNYTPALPLPAGMSEDELMIFHYDESAGTLKKVIEYTGVTLTRDTVANTITVHNWTGPLSPFGPGGLSPPTPVTLSRWVATSSQEGIVVEWTTKSEVDLAGFYVLRSATEEGEYERLNDVMIEAKGSPIDGWSYRFVDRSSLEGSCYYKLKAVELDGGEDVHGPILVASPVPNVFALSQNVPNPFNAMTDIRYALPGAGWVRLALYDLLGQEVRVLFEGVQEAGEHMARWDGQNGSGEEMGSGVYVVRLVVAGQGTETRKVVLLR